MPQLVNASQKVFELSTIIKSFPVSGSQRFAGELRQARPHRLRTCVKARWGQQDRHRGLGCRGSGPTPCLRTVPRGSACSRSGSGF